MLTRHSLALVCGLLVAGCATSSPKQVETAAALPPPAKDGTYEVKAPDSGHYVFRAHQLAVGPDEAAKCRVSPHFAFGSSEPLPQDVNQLKNFASCVNSEAAQDKTIEIVGHSDARGSSDRNLMLAMARAEKVRDILVKQGVKQERMLVRSVGEQGTLGFLSMYSHGFDRRVDVALVYEVHEPADTNRYDVTAWKQ